MNVSKNHQHSVHNAGSCYRPIRTYSETCMVITMIHFLCLRLCSPIAPFWKITLIIYTKKFANIMELLFFLLSLMKHNHFKWYFMESIDHVIIQKANAHFC